MSIRRQLEGLSSGKRSNIAFHHNPEKVLNPLEKLSGNEHCCGSLKAKVYKNTDSGRAKAVPCHVYQQKVLQFLSLRAKLLCYLNGL